MSDSTVLRTLSRGWWRTRRRIGLAGMAGVLALLAAAGLLAALPAAERDVDALRWQLVRQGQALRDAPPALPAAPDAETQVRDFVAVLPPLARQAEDVGTLLACARRAKVDLPRADYALKAEARAPAAEYQVTLPMHEPYPALKRFVADVLGRLPHASLDELRMARADASGEVLDATVRFTLHYRNRDAGDAGRRAAPGGRQP